MRIPSFLADRLREFLHSQKIATLPELKQALGTTVDITVFRKLKELSYRSSYSHRGHYYTLTEIPQFDPQGLWSFQAVWFSRWGNLVTTLEALVGGAPQGYFASELQQLLHVEVKDALLQLVEQRRIARQQVTGLFLYCSQDAALRRRQAPAVAATAIGGNQQPPRAQIQAAALAAPPAADRSHRERACVVVRAHVDKAGVAPQVIDPVGIGVLVGLKLRERRLCGRKFHRRRCEPKFQRCRLWRAA